MKHKKLSISIGIPAYNEETNIRNLLLSILSQEEEGFAIREIFVISDGSTDRTVEEARLVKDRRIRVIDHCDRQGQAARQNEILEFFKGDYLVLLNADVLLEDREFLKRLLYPFTQDKRIGIVGGKPVSLPAQNFFEKVINFSTAFKQDLYEKINHGDNLYLCHGRVRAFSRDFGKHFRWAAIPGEDAFSYLTCLKQGFIFFYQPQAEVRYRSPQNLRDHLLQSLRFFQREEKLKEYFPAVLLKTSCQIPLGILLQTTLINFFRHPILFGCYVWILSLAYLLSKTQSESTMRWRPSLTSKTLISKKS